MFLCTVRFLFSYSCEHTETFNENYLVFKLYSCLIENTETNSLQTLEGKFFLSSPAILSVAEQLNKPTMQNNESADKVVSSRSILIQLWSGRNFLYFQYQIFNNRPVSVRHMCLTLLLTLLLC